MRLKKIQLLFAIIFVLGGMFYQLRAHAACDCYNLLLVALNGCDSTLTGRMTPYTPAETVSTGQECVMGTDGSGTIWGGECCTPAPTYTGTWWVYPCSTDVCGQTGTRGLFCHPNNEGDSSPTCDPNNQPNTSCTGSCYNNTFYSCSSGSCSEDATCEANNGGSGCISDPNCNGDCSVSDGESD